MNIFDAKFGENFVEGIPKSPGVYHFINHKNEVIYVGKSKNLRKRLEQYRNAKKKKKQRKMRKIIADSYRIQFDVCSSEFEAEIKETKLIQALRPKWNIAGAFYFMYPMIGIKKDENFISFCYTTKPELCDNYSFHGAFRSREITKNAFSNLVLLLNFIGHRMPIKFSSKIAKPKYASISNFRQIPESIYLKIRPFFMGESNELLETLVLELIENAGARKRKLAIQDALDELDLFWKAEAVPLCQARTSVNETTYPISQTDRDLLFLKYKHKALSQDS